VRSNPYANSFYQEAETKLLHKNIIVSWGFVPKSCLTQYKQDKYRSRKNCFSKTQKTLRYRIISNIYIYIYIYIISSNGVLVGKLIFVCYEETYGPNVVFKISYNLTVIPSEKNRVQSSIVPITTTLLVTYSQTLSHNHLSMRTASGYSRFTGHLPTWLRPFVVFLSLCRYLPQ